MCLAVTQPPNAATHLQRTREKIGFGITLSREGDGDESGVWLYNRSEHPVFAHSPTLELPNVRTPLVTKIPPGHCIKLFDYALSEVFETLREPRSSDGPIDPHAVQISFVKGWGLNYSRQFVTSCDCWLEVLFNRWCGVGEVSQVIIIIWSYLLSLPMGIYREVKLIILGIVWKYVVKGFVILGKVGRVIATLREI